MLSMTTYVHKKPGGQIAPDHGSICILGACTCSDATHGRESRVQSLWKVLNVSEPGGESI